MKTKRLSPADGIKGRFQKEPAKRDRKIDRMRRIEKPRGQKPNAQICRCGVDSCKASLFQRSCAEAEGRKGRSMEEKTAGETKRLSWFQ